jgi:rhamnose transport system permease protein
MSTASTQLTNPAGPRGSDAGESTRSYRLHARPLWKRWLLTHEAAIIGLLVAVFAWANVNVENFDGPLTLFYLFLDTAPLLMIALPMTLVIITGEIDLSVASIVGLSAGLVGIFHVDVGLSIPVAGLLAVVFGIVAGTLNGFLVAYVGLPSLAVTIGTLALFRGIAVGLLGDTPITEFDDKWTDLATERIVEESSYPLVLVPIAVLVVVFALLLHFTPFGRGIYDIGLNDQAARFTGVSVERTKLLLFVLSGAVSALAGIYYALRFGSVRGDSANGLELQVVAAVLLGGVSIFGGRGALHGVLAGVLLIGVIASAMRLEGQTVNMINIVTGVLLVLSVISTSFLTWASGLRSGRTWPWATRSRPDSAGPRSQS